MKFIEKILSILKGILLGKSINESANLEDFKYARWCLYLYIILAGTYWYFEIGIPHWDGPREDFRQLMEHEALVKLTVVFGATMGLIALLHRSIVSDYQIKQQNRTELISNYYKVSEHINTHAPKIFFEKNDEIFRPGDNFPYCLMDSLFGDAKNGYYHVSLELISLIASTSTNFTPYSKSFSEYKIENIASKFNDIEQSISKHEKTDDIINIFCRIDSYKHSSIQAFLILNTVYSNLLGNDLRLDFNNDKATESQLYLKDLTTNRRLNPTNLYILNRDFSSILGLIDIEEPAHLKNAGIKENISHMMRLISSLQAKLKAIRNTLSTIPLDDFDTKFFYQEESKLSKYLLFEMSGIVEVYESIVYSYNNPKVSGDSFWGGVLIYLYTCDRLKVRVSLSESIINSLFDWFENSTGIFTEESEFSMRDMKLVLDEIKTL